MPRKAESPGHLPKRTDLFANWALKCPRRMRFMTATIEAN